MKFNQYKELLQEVKLKIQHAQIRTVMAANSQMLLLYWQLGNYILANQQTNGWGAKIIPQLSHDLKRAFPTTKGFSPRNLLYMKQFAESYPYSIIDAFVKIEHQIKAESNVSQQLFVKLLQTNSTQFLIMQQPVAQLEDTINAITQQPAAQLEGTINSISQQPVAKLKTEGESFNEELFLQSILARTSWSHHITLIHKEEHIGKRFWYMLNSLEHGNSRNVLAMQIESGLYERQVSNKKTSNFVHTLPPIQSDYANYLLKDPYIFDFVQAKEKADERNIEEQLASHITKFLLELGQGFAFIGRQVHFEIGGDDFYADLLFYHTRLHCYVVVELKARPFEPGDASQLNFYVNVVNDKLKTTYDNDTIGLLLCKGKNEVIAEYALKGYNNAIGISDYQISKAIPEELKSLLPQVEDIENEFKEKE